jgi:hypothetical protein
MPTTQTINYRTTSRCQYADTPIVCGRQFCGQITVKCSIGYIPYCIILSSSASLSRTSASGPIPRILQLLDARMGDGPTRSFFPFLDGQLTDRASTSNIHLMSQIDHHARDHEFSAETLTPSDMFSCFFSTKWTVNRQVRHLRIHLHTISPLPFSPHGGYIPPVSRPLILRTHPVSFRLEGVTRLGAPRFPKISEPFSGLLFRPPFRGSPDQSSKSQQWPDDPLPGRSKRPPDTPASAFPTGS